MPGLFSFAACPSYTRSIETHLGWSQSERDREREREREVDFIPQRPAIESLGTNDILEDIKETALPVAAFNLLRLIKARQPSPTVLSKAHAFRVQSYARSRFLTGNYTFRCDRRIDVYDVSPVSFFRFLSFHARGILSGDELKKETFSMLKSIQRKRIIDIIVVLNFYWRQ